MLAKLLRLLLRLPAKRMSFLVNLPWVRIPPHPPVQAHQLGNSSGTACFLAAFCGARGCRLRQQMLCLFATSSAPSSDGSQAPEEVSPLTSVQVLRTRSGGVR